MVIRKKQIKRGIRHFQSIRWGLPLSYAGIALLTTLVLGGILLFGLNDFYNQREQEYLEGNALAISPFLEAVWSEETDMSQLNPVLAQVSFFSDTRLRLLDTDKTAVIDTGYQVDRHQFTVNLAEPFTGGSQVIGPMPANAVTVSNDPTILDFTGDTVVTSGMASSTGGVSFFTLDVIDPEFDNVVITGMESKPHPDKYRRPPETLWTIENEPVLVGQRFPFFIERRAFGGYSFDSERNGKGKDIPLSDQTYLRPLHDENDNLLGYLELSGGPALGTTILETVRESLLSAGLLAVLLAASVGWIASRNLSQPLRVMAHATEQMAEGDHSTRVDLHRHDELGVLAQSFNNMAERVELTIATLQRFIADAAHEIQTPITAMQTNLELAVGDAETYAHYVTQAQQQLTRLSNLTQNLLNLARIESHELVLNRQQMDLGVLLRQISEGYASRAEQAEIGFSLDLPDESVLFNGDEAQLTRVVDNLLDNALKFTPKAGQVTVKLATETDLVRLIVEDTGIGIPVADQPHLFNRFRRGRNATTYPGSGLGLVLAKTIVEAHQGTIEFTSNATRTHFVVDLPQTSSEDNSL